MSKLIPSVLVATTVLMGQVYAPGSALAGTCASKCPPKPLQFIPGQSITVEVVNQTASLVEFQKVYGTNSVPMRPGQSLRFERGGGTDPNISVFFWDVTALPLAARLSQPDPQTLRIELRPGGRPPGDRSVYVLNDGRVAIF
jgi:hypothetical protein